MGSMIKKVKFVLFLAVIIIPVFILIYFIYKNEAELQSAKSPYKTVTLPVTEISVQYGSEVPSKVNIPKTIDVIVLNDYADKIGAYGMYFGTYVGPKDWTGKATEGGGGSLVVELYPSGGSTKSGPSITFYDVPACRSCILTRAALFWSQAKKELIAGNFTVPEPPAGLKVLPITQQIALFTLPDTNDGLGVNGVAYVKKVNGKVDAPFKQVTIKLPKEDYDLAKELRNIYLDREVLK